MILVLSAHIMPRYSIGQPHFF